MQVPSKKLSQDSGQDDSIEGLELTSPQKQTKNTKSQRTAEPLDFLNAPKTCGEKGGRGEEIEGLESFVIRCLYAGATCCSSHTACLCRLPQNQCCCPISNDPLPQPSLCHHPVYFFIAFVTSRNAPVCWLVVVLFPTRMLSSSRAGTSSVLSPLHNGV